MGQRESVNLLRSKLRSAEKILKARLICDRDVSMTQDSMTDWIAGFWGRIAAFTIDTLILGTVGLLIGLFTVDYLVQLEELGVLVGFGIALAYFGSMNSRISNGQTLGKMVLRIRVVDVNNDSISVGRSFVRSSVLCIPYFLGGVSFGSSDTAQIGNRALSVIMVGGLLSIAYLYIFNQATRQSLHDLAVRSFVARSDHQRGPINPFWAGHYGVAGAIFLFTAMTFMPGRTYAPSEPVAALVEASELLEADPVVLSAVVSDTRMIKILNDSGAIESARVGARLVLKEDLITDANTAQQFARLLVTAYKPTMERDLILITLAYGYDIGIAASWKSQMHRFEPSELTDAE